MVVEEPWVTIAESSELVMALARLGEVNRAQEIFFPAASMERSKG
ncbi:MAG: hypothetical protein Ct9H300mP20_22710 [Gammaproteobacteria bacterium]|nr:MAG: hypothetical protein Ct9H300mP20_22710 [Gammaproteobacteria bacterium]